MNSDHPFTVHGDEALEARIVAWVLGEASAFEEAELERLCEERPELLVFRRRMRALHGLLTEAEKQQPDEGWKLPEEKRRVLDEIFGETKVVPLEAEKEKPVRHTGRKILLAIAASVVIGFVVLSSMPTKYESVATLEVRPRTPGMAPLSSNMDASNARAMTSQFFGTEFEIIKSRNNLEKVVDNLNLQSRWNVDKETAIAKLKGIVDAQNIKGTDLMSIRVRSTNKEDARDIADAVTKEYKSYRETLERKDEEKQLLALRKAVQAQEDKVEERRKVLSTIARTKGIIYKGDGDLVDGDQGAKNALSMYHGLEQEKIQLESQINSLQKYDNDQLMTYASGLDLPDNTVRNIYPQYLEAKRQLEAQKINGQGDKHPSVLAAEDTVQRMKRQLDEGVVNLRDTLKAQLDLTNDRFNTVKAMKDDTRDDAIRRGLDAQDYVDAKRDLETDQELLQQMKLKLIGEDTSAEMQMETVRIHERPVEGKKVGPLQSIFGLFGDREAQPNADLAAAKSEQRVEFLSRETAPAVAGEKRSGVTAMNDAPVAMEETEITSDRSLLADYRDRAESKLAKNEPAAPASPNVKRNVGSGSGAAFSIPDAPADLGVIAGATQPRKPFGMQETPMPKKVQSPTVPAALPEGAARSMRNNKAADPFGRTSNLEAAEGEDMLSDANDADGTVVTGAIALRSAELKPADGFAGGRPAGLAAPREPASAPQSTTAAPAVASDESDLVKLMSSGGIASGGAAGGFQQEGSTDYYSRVVPGSASELDTAEPSDFKSSMDADSSPMPSLSSETPPAAEGQPLADGLRSGDAAITRNSIDSILADGGKGQSELEPSTSATNGGIRARVVAGAADASDSAAAAGKGELAEREMIRRQDAVKEGEKLQADGKDAFAKGDYQAAFEKFDGALGALPKAPMLEDKQKSIQAQRDEAALALAKQNRKVGKYDEAKRLLEEVAKNDPANVEAKRELDSINDPIRSNAALAVEHGQNVDAIRRNLYLAEGSYNLGKYDDAKKAYEEALKADPYNAAARRGMERINQAKADSYRAAYDQTRAELLARVDAGWDLAVPAEGNKRAEETSKDLEGVADEGAPITGKAKARAKELVLPEPQTKPDLTKFFEEVASADEPYSTFSLNISDASFQIAQAAMAKGERPDPAGVKVEQFYNAMDYGDPAPAAGEPVAVNIEQSAHPVIPGRNLVRVALKTAAAGRAASQALHLTLLVDQSGSMSREDRRSAMKQALGSLGGLLSNNDTVTVVGFSRTPRLLADGLSGDQSKNLPDLINVEASEGGTNLEEAMKLGEQLALRHKLPGVQNRIVLFTDGAANLGDADPEKLAERVKQLRQKGIAFDIAGIAAADLNDGLLAELARNGNGRYYVVGKGDNDSFAKQLAGAFRPAAENVKVQVRFNPERVLRYKLIGFEKDRLKTEDFRNDAVDAAEMAAEEAGVAIYQIEPIPGGKGEIGEVSVRFRDTAADQMVERSWTISHNAATPAFDRATPSMQLTTFAMLVAEKLKGGAFAEAIDFKQLSGAQANVKRFFGEQGRPAELLHMVDALK